MAESRGVDKGRDGRAAMRYSLHHILSNSFSASISFHVYIGKHNFYKHEQTMLASQPYCQLMRRPEFRDSK